MFRWPTEQRTMHLTTDNGSCAQLWTLEVIWQAYKFSTSTLLGLLMDVSLPACFIEACLLCHRLPAVQRCHSCRVASFLFYIIGVSHTFKNISFFKFQVCIWSIWSLYIVDCAIFSAHVTVKGLWGPRKKFWGSVRNNFWLSGVIDTAQPTFNLNISANMENTFKMWSSGPRDEVWWKIQMLKILWDFPWSILKGHLRTYLNRARTEKVEALLIPIKSAYRDSPTRLLAFYFLRNGFLPSPSLGSAGTLYYR